MMQIKLVGGLWSGRQDGKGWGTANLRAMARATALGGVVLLFQTGVVAQQTAPEALDVNAVRAPADASTLVNPTPPSQPEAEAAEPAAAEAEIDSQIYPVTAFRLEYANLSADQAAELGLPTLEELGNSWAELARSGDAFVAPSPGGSSNRRRVADVGEAGGDIFAWSGISKVAEAIVRTINARGVIACFVEVPEILDDKTDDRADKTAPLLLRVWVGRIGENGIRSISSGERLTSSETRVNPSDSVHERIRGRSPAQPGMVLNQEGIDEYVYRLNRHPGRRVDVSLAPGSENGEVVLDYLVSENKPWSLYAQISNTGTEATSEWRQRFGFIHNQLSGNDDILRIDYITGGFDSAHALSASYEFPVFSDRVRLRPFVNYSEFEASDVGVGEGREDFSGTSYSGGVEAIGNIYQHRQFFLDLFGGGRYQYNEIEGPTATGEAEFWVPYIGLRAERIEDASYLSASLSYEANVNNWTDDARGTGDDLNSLGRSDINEYWQLVKWDSEFSFYLEPLLYDREWRGEATDNKSRKSLAHEIGLTFRGQYSPNDRLIPNEEEVVGGLYSVRGYSESVTAGDTVLIGSVEYRFHLPRVLGYSDPVNESLYWQPGRFGSQDAGVLGDNFRWAPQADFGRADWDLILRAFFDAGSAYTVRRQSGEDLHNTLFGTGVGVELQIKRNFVARLDWGVALTDVDEIVGGADITTGAESGDTQLHFSATVLY